MCPEIHPQAADTVALNSTLATQAPSADLRPVRVRKREIKPKKKNINKRESDVGEGKKKNSFSS